MRFGLSEKTIELIKYVFSRYPEVQQVQIFGSRALTHYRENSDIDIVIFGAISSKIQAKILLELEELPLLYKFDLVSFDDITHAGLKEHILLYGKELY